MLFRSAYKAVISGNGRIGDYAFRGTTLKEISFKDGIIALGVGSFCSTTTLLKVEFSPSIKIIGEWCFNSADNLNEVIFKEGLEEIQWGAFCISSLVNVELPLSCKTVGGKAFCDVPTLQTIKGNGVETLGEYTFSRATALTHAEFNNLKTMDEGVFSGLKNISSFNFPEGLQVIGRYAFQSTNLLEANLPNTLTTLGEGAFQSTPMEYLYIPDSVTTLESPTAWSGKLKVLSIPNSNFINNNTTIACDSTLQHVIIRKTNGVLDISMFSHDYLKNWVTYVPDELVDAYRNNADYIRYNANIQPLSSCPPEYLK